LADHIVKIAPIGGVVVGYHQLGDRIAKQLGTPIDFQKASPFAQMEKILDSYTPSDDQMFDDLIVDEGQDFKRSWALNLMRLIRPNGKAWWLEDPLQNLYSREAMTFEGWVSIRSDANFRSPKKILSSINQILTLNPPIQALSPIDGDEVDVIVYEDQTEVIAKTIEALDLAVALGFSVTNIVLLSFRGRESSLLTPFTQIGKHVLKAPIQGQYDEIGNQEYTEGNILTDSIHRFKGQAAPCVILTEIDFISLDNNSKVRFFVGATRATIKLILVISKKSLNTILAAA
jgi:superfamily I DNA/RNA helicase